MEMMAWSLSKEERAQASFPNSTQSYLFETFRQRITVPSAPEASSMSCLSFRDMCKSCRISQNTPPDQSSETLSWLRCGSPSSPSTIRSTEAQFVHIRNAIADNLNNSPTKAGHHQDAGLEAGCFANAA